MSESDSIIDADPDDWRVERLLDGLSSVPEKDAVREKLRAEGLGGDVALHDVIDSALRRRFPVVAAPPQQVAELVAAAEHARSAAGWRSAVIAAASLAAMVLIAFAWGQRGSRDMTPFFEPAPLVALYHEAVQQGFEPYYECEDPERFAAVFAKRQDQPLRLDEMSPGSRMLGLSYPGGLSRDTTAMLCKVDGQPVMVFVDRLDADQQSSAITAAGDGLRVFRSELAGLVLYEVTPLKESRAAPYLAAP